MGFDFDALEGQVDRFLSIWFPWIVLCVCLLSVFYFGGHVLLWWLGGAA